MCAFPSQVSNFLMMMVKHISEIPGIDVSPSGLEALQGFDFGNKYQLVFILHKSALAGVDLRSETSDIISDLATFLHFL